MPKTNTELSHKINTIESMIILERLGYMKNQSIQYNCKNNYTGNSYSGNTYSGNTYSENTYSENSSVQTKSLFDF